MLCDRPVGIGVVLTDLEEAGLVVGQTQLRIAEHVDAVLLLQRTDQQAERVARRREDQPADAKGTRPADAEVTEALEADDAGAVGRRDPVAGR